ncbi:hypothetical protein [Brevundimonas sp.]|uniref:hypothetical protein n=1 Tax=Brevundimonas sp. TaxID=1871086 RepID=UPI002D363B0F|nr:hypothetical protein [Brevundimonas sp.]HYC67883.1 hypothetical protein [Brevundimonas sp.]
MGKVVSGGAAAAIGLLLAGCSTTLLVHVAGPLHQPVFTPERRAGPVCFSELTIQAGPTAPLSEDLVVWRIEGRDGGCVRFGPLVYGEAPSGAVELVAAKPLREGVVYSATARGDIRGPFGAIWIGGGAYVFEEGAWRAAES